jgi:hypothetical protein
MGWYGREAEGKEEKGKQARDCTSNALHAVRTQHFDGAREPLDCEGLTREEAHETRLLCGDGAHLGLRVLEGGKGVKGGGFGRGGESARGSEEKEEGRRG